MGARRTEGKEEDINQQEHWGAQQDRESLRKTKGSTSETQFLRQKLNIGQKPEGRGRNGRTFRLCVGGPIKIRTKVVWGSEEAKRKNRSKTRKAKRAPGRNKTTEAGTPRKHDFTEHAPKKKTGTNIGEKTRKMARNHKAQTAGNRGRESQGTSHQTSYRGQKRGCDRVKSSVGGEKKKKRTKQVPRDGLRGHPTKGGGRSQEKKGTRPGVAPRKNGNQCHKLKK